MAGADRLLADTNALIYLDQGNREVLSLMDGKEIYISFISEIELLGFHQLSKTKLLHLKEMIDEMSISGGVSLAFSPSGRFIYIDLPQQINQYDLSPSRTGDSIRIFTDSSTEFYELNIIQLAPNGKMYISCWDGGSYKIHVINKPDSLGAACDFQFLGQPVASLNPVSLPYFPNFRLGPVSGSPCDTLTEIEAIAAAHPAFAQIMPNPASDQAVLVYYTGSNTANQAVMYDVTGREVWIADVTGSAGNINMNLSSFPAGIYMVKFTADGNTLMNTKLVVDR